MTLTRWIMSICAVGLLPAIVNAQTIDWDGPPPPNQTTPSSPGPLIITGSGSFTIPQGAFLVEVRFKYKPMMAGVFKSLAANTNVNPNT